MKKIFILFTVFIGCATSANSPPVFDHTLIKQINIKNPSFLIIAEKDENNYYLNQIEDAFIKNKITLYSEESQISTSEGKGKSGGVVITNNGLVGFGGGKSQSVITDKTINVNKTNATCIYLMDCYNWTFKVISAQTRELLMKGRIKYDFDMEISRMYRELTGQ
jgi:hypothetical protein